MTFSFLSRLIKIRNRTLHFLRNKPKAKLKTDKRPEIPCFRGRDISITSYQTLVILHIIDSCQTLGFLKCLVFFIFCLAIFLKELHKNVKAPKWELRESILNLMFSYLLPFILAATCYAKSQFIASKSRSFAFKNFIS